MIVEYKAVIKKVIDNDVHVHVERTLENVFTPHLVVIFIALLRNMKETDKKAFYDAMSYFISEELDDD